MEIPTKEEIARLVVIWACQGRRDLAEQTADGNWDGAWQQIGVSRYLESEVVRDELQAYFKGDGADRAAQNEVFVESRWRAPPCPRDGFVTAALEAMIKARDRLAELAGSEAAPGEETSSRR